MSTMRQVVGLAVLAAMTAACAAGTKSSVSPAPKAGPKAYVSVTYFGGLLNRTAHARFQVDEPAYVIVGHLGGDGQLRIIYPDHARQQRQVAPGSMIRTGNIPAQYDGAPGLFRFVTNAYRTPSARMASYDGRGFAYIFVIASRTPFKVDAASDWGEWSDLVVEDYHASFDPRQAINAFAKSIVGHDAYTLEYASSYRTVAMTSHIDRRWDCAMLSGFGISLAALSSGWGYAYRYGNFHGWGYNSYCGNSAYVSYARYITLHRLYNDHDPQRGTPQPWTPRVTEVSTSGPVPYRPDPRGRAIDRERRRPSGEDDRGERGRDLDRPGTPTNGARRSEPAPARVDRQDRPPQASSPREIRTERPSPDTPDKPVPPKP